MNHIFSTLTSGYESKFPLLDMKYQAIAIDIRQWERLEVEFSSMLN